MSATIRTVGEGYGEHEDAIARYREEGEARAMALGNRGPVRFNADGSLHEKIVEAYWRCGFYIFEGVLGDEELAELAREVDDLIERAPVKPGSQVDKFGRPSPQVGHKHGGFSLVRPLSDPIGGTDGNNGRHPAKMIEPEAPDDAPEYVLQVIGGSLQFSDAALRTYGHPALLGVAAAINGEDFSPFNEVIFIKQPGLGGSVAWHQDGTTHWETEKFHKGSHGFNFMAQVHGCNAANGLWVVPGSHLSQADIRSMCEAAGSDRLPEAVPMICAPGDVGMCNRQAVHGSFANTSSDLRVTINFGFHPRASVVGARGNGIHARGSQHIIYDEERVQKRSEILGIAIAARRERFPVETSFSYKPHIDAGLSFEWNDGARERLFDYNQLDLGI
ncbi:MAG: phytanoyl-CoA dioxygenase family protein [Pseudomonadota bacterium]|nr:phytanoyl-CoA dioxygenase family protein [Pseudomonadota bacterium]